MQPQPVQKLHKFKMRAGEWWNVSKNTIILMLSYLSDTASILEMQHISKQLQLDLCKHNAQYTPVNIKEFNKAHDRFLIIDNQVYHIGASMKDLGKKWFAFSLIKDLTPTELITKI